MASKSWPETGIEALPIDLSGHLLYATADDCCRQLGGLTDTMAIETPCIKICVLDRESRICLGCGRTVGEIGSWVSLSDQDRRRIMHELPERLTRLKSDHAGAKFA
jgi:predicted Fe-S protein YdhL (DUF1289 family)